MLRKIRSLFRRPAEERRALVIAYTLLIISRAMLDVLPQSLTRRMMFGRLRLPPCVHAGADLITWSIETAARHVPRATCLVRTLAGRLFFSLAALDSRAHLGATAADGPPSFHAWLEHDGRAVIGALPEMPRSFFL